MKYAISHPEEISRVRAGKRPQLATREKHVSECVPSRSGTAAGGYVWLRGFCNQGRNSRVVTGRKM